MFRYLWIHSIVYPKDYQLSHTDIVGLEIHDRIIWKMPLRVLEALFGSEDIPYTSNKRITLPIELCPVINIKLAFHSCTGFLNMNTNAYMNVSYMVLEQDLRKKLCLNNSEFNVFTCLDVHTQSPNATNRLYWEGSTTGIFIDTTECSSYSKTHIRNVKDYDLELTPDIAIRTHSDTILYHSFTGKQSLLSCIEHESYSNKAPLTMLKSLTICTDTKEESNESDKIHYYCLVRNKITYTSGMGFTENTSLTYTPT